MIDNTHRNYWIEHYNNSDNFAALFSDFSRLKEKSEKEGLNSQEKAQFHAAELVIDGKLH